LLNLLQTRTGRLTAFFLLYMTEGIPLGFTATAIATQMRRQGLSPSEIGAFVGALYLPWAWKWAIGPIVDSIYSDRLGRRRMWIVGAQLGMIATLLALLPIDFTTDLALYTSLIIAHNIFGATQDVAIDALAVNTLSESDRGVANGLMFAGAYLGQTVGGAGVLFLIPYIGLRGSFVAVAAAIGAVTLTVSVGLREKPGEPRTGDASPVARVWSDMRAFLVGSVKAMFGSRVALAALVVALLPAGAQALTLSLSSNLAVELGMSDSEIGTLSLYGTVIAAVGCVAGGWVSDRFGRRKTLAAFLVGTAVPTAWLAYEMQRHGWIAPVPLDAPDRPAVPAALVTVFWIASLTHAVFTGLMYGIRTALYMDVTTAAVAATQFTAYMAMLNVVTTYSAWWQGVSLERWGYPATLAADSALGLVCIAVLPLTRTLRHPPTDPRSSTQAPQT